MKKCEKKLLPTVAEILWKIVIIALSLTGVYLQARDGGGFFRSNTYLYFTIISNFGIAVISLIFFILETAERVSGKYHIRKWLFTLKYMFTAAMSLTLIVSACLLAPFKDRAYLLSMKNLSLHIFAPFAAAVDFLAFDKRFEFRKRTALAGFVLPLIYILR